MIPRLVAVTLVLLALPLAGCPWTPHRMDDPSFCMGKAGYGELYLDPAEPSRKHKRVFALVHTVSAEDGTPYVPVFIGTDEQAAGGGVSYLELGIKANHEILVVLADDGSLPLSLASGETPIEEMKPPIVHKIPASEWWAYPNPPASVMRFDEREATGRIWVVRMGPDEVDGDVWRIHGWASAIFHDETQTGCAGRLDLEPFKD